MNISKDQDLAILEEETQDLILNQEIALFLYKKSGGKAGLTVELIRDAVKRAINSGRSFPTKSDYKLVILECADNKKKQNILFTFFLENFAFIWKIQHLFWKFT